MIIERNLEAEYDDWEFIPLCDTRDWSSFWLENEAELSAIGDERSCFELAMNCSLFVGGGAAPLFRIGFVDARP